MSDQIHGTLRPPNLLVCAIVTNDGLEERRFAFQFSAMPEPQLGNEIRLALEPGDPLEDLPEWKESEGWLFVTKRALDFVAGHLWVELHFLAIEQRAIHGL